MTTEQMTVSAEEQMTAAAEQAAPVAEPAEGAVATGEQRAVADLDLSTPEAARRFAAEHPAFQAVFADERNAERQRALAEIQREQGSAERAQGTTRWVAEQLQNGVSPDEIAKQIIPHVKANENWTRAEMLKGLIAQARSLDEDAVAPLAELADALEGNVDEIEKVAQAALNAVSNRSGNSARQALLDTEDLDAIPKDSKLGRALQAAIEREAETEMNARTVEANKVTAPPKTPGGTSTEQMTHQAYEAMSPTDRKAYLADVKKRDGNLDAVWDLISA